jgi:hypothetical protein
MARENRFKSEISMLKDAERLLERHPAYVEAFGGGPIEQMHADVAQYDLPAGVPDGVRRSFDAARHTYIYSYFSYDLLTPAVGQLFACLELALRKHLGLPSSGKSQPPNLSELLRDAKDQGQIQTDASVVHQIRNVFLHGTDAIIEPNMFLGMLEKVTILLQELYSHDRTAGARGGAVEVRPMARRDRLRRVSILCAEFARNLAYYRVGQSQSGSVVHAPSHRQTSFWRQANGNFLDVSVLAWCKLLGDNKGKHFWRRIVADPVAFEAGLLAHLKMTNAEFGIVVDAMRHYRDKFVAHLDSDLVMQIPTLSAAQSAVWFYHDHVVRHEGTGGELNGLPQATAGNLALGYAQCMEEAEQVYRAACP